ncbi:hypothetical protein [Nocardia veterana]|uniref:Uncharacterized protein n=1 Tax=Nocardia veterana TaxID=132249 RepID=A0A7X6M327_9NOCA|nr:hypothetical protein [Nocardia veterana]NKY88844.1 hypothetical protein [Nocardia veterana]
MHIPARPSSARQAGALALAITVAAAVALAAYLLARHPQRTTPPAAQPQPELAPPPPGAIRAQFRPELLRSRCERLEDIDEADLLAEYHRAHRAAERARSLPFDRADPESLQLWTGHRDALAAEAARRYVRGPSPASTIAAVPRNHA